MGKLLSIDFGDRWFGLALSDATRTLARPLERVRGQTDLWKRLETLVPEEDVECIVVGLPKNMDGSLGPKARTVLEFVERLKERCGLAVETWDERLTTVEAERRLKLAGSAPRRHRQRVDPAAAQIILQSYMDRQSRK